MRFLLLLFCLSIGFCLEVAGQVEVMTGFTPEHYVNDVLLGNGVTATNVVYQGDAGQIGEVLNLGDFGMPIQGGLALGSGLVDFLAESTNGDDCGENFPNVMTSTMTPEPLATDLLNIANSVPPLIGQSFSVSDVNDIAVIEFDFVATADSVKIDYIFASVEYPNYSPGLPYYPTGPYVNSPYNDVFAFFLSGPGINGPYANNAINIAVVPESDPELPITISSVNGALNGEFFVENTDRDPICPDGYTVKLTCESEVECGETYHMTIAIGDGSDNFQSSFVILEEFQSNGVVDIDLSIDVGTDVVNDPPIMFEDCGTATMVFTRPEETNLDVQEELEIVYNGTATYGVDYSAMPTSVVFPVGVETQEYVIEAFLDGVAEGVETVQMEILNLAACSGGGVTSYYEFNINDTAEPLQVDGFNTSLCTGDSVTLEPVITGGYGNFIFDWSCNPGEDTVAYNFVPTVPGLFNCVLTVSDTCGMPSDAATFEVDVIEYPPIAVDLGPDLVLPCNGMQTVFSNVTGGNPGVGGYTYSWEDQDGFPLFSWTDTSLDVATWMGVTEITLIVEDECGLTGSATINVSVDSPELYVELDASYDVNCNVPFSITPEVNGGQSPYNFTWTEGFLFLGFNSTLDWTTDTDMVVNLGVTDSCGQFVELSTNINVLSAPEYALYGAIGVQGGSLNDDDPHGLCLGDIVLFEVLDGDNCAVGEASSWFWEFGDGTILESTNTVVPHLFAEAGCYTVTLTALDAEDTPLGIPDTISVLVTPEIDWSDWAFDLPVAGCSGMEVACSASPVVLDGGGSLLPDVLGVIFDAELLMEGTGIISNACDLEVTANMYHSYMGDLTIWLECPNGQQVLLMDNGASGGPDTSGCMYPDLGNIYLGLPADGSGQNGGEGWDYSWSNAGAYIMDDPSNPSAQGVQSLPEGVYQPCGDFCDLEGCPISGTWSLNFTDGWGADAGAVVAWGISGINELTCYDEQLDATGEWIMGTATVPGLDAEFLLTVPGNQIVSFSTTNGGGCSADTSFTIDVADPTGLGITAGPDLLVCSAPVVLQGGFNGSGASNCSSSQGTQTVCYGNNANDIYTYCPDNPGDGTMMSIAFFDGEIEFFNDYINVFDGSDVNAPLVETWFGTYAATNVMATNPDGCLTVQVTSDVSFSCATGNYDPVSWCVGCADGSSCDYQWDWEPSELLENPTSATPTISGWNGEEQTFIAEVEVLSLANCIVTDTMVVAPEVPGFHLDGYSNTTCNPDSGGLWLTVQYDGPEPMPTYELSVNGTTLQAEVGQEFHYATLSNDVFVATLTAGEEACLVGQQQFTLYFPACVEVGCTDSLACNFNPEAELEDGTCLYADDPCEYCTQDGMVGVDSSFVCGGLDVQVVMDTVLYEGFADVPPGFRRYRIYAEIPDGYLMLGPAADEFSTPVIPAFGYNAPCGCYNQESAEFPNGYNNGSTITAEALAADASLAYDSWWTTHLDQTNTTSTVIEIPTMFEVGFDICSDEVTSGGLFVTGADPVHATVTNGRALVGQITTCESFSFKVCVAMQSSDFGVTSLCTDGEIQVPDLCAPIHEATINVLDDAVQVVSQPLPASTRYRLLDWSGNILEEQFSSGIFNDIPTGIYQVELLDTATTVAWSSNTCRNHLPFAIECEGGGGTVAVYGCTFAPASNYNPDATIDDGSCILPGCLDHLALNFNPYATISDGSCIDACGNCPGDLNADGLVSVADLVVFLQNFGIPCGLVDQPCSSVTFDGYTYDVVEIGDQCWFAENLRTTVYANGSPVTLYEDWSQDWNDPFCIVYGEGGFDCNGDCDPVENLVNYGRLYSQRILDGSQNVCPSGWHVSTKDDWIALQLAIGGDDWGGVSFTAEEVQLLRDNTNSGSCPNSGSLGFNARAGGVFGTWPGDNGGNGICCANGFSYSTGDLNEFGYFGVPVLQFPQSFAPIWIGCDWGGEEGIGNNNAYSVRCVKD